MSGDAGSRVLGGKYRLDRVLAVGGMGEVWLAYHLELRSTVAVKLMAPGLLPDPAALTRFRLEARAAARLRNPHVVTVHDFGEQDGTPYLVMEFLEGETLQERLARIKTIPAGEAAILIRQACTALSVAHAQGIVHRDIKPSNLFLTKAGEPFLKLLDFGIVHAALDDENTSVTRSGTIVGSPAFMSPEQASGEPVSPGSDLWSLAAVAYRMSTGHEPFTGRTVNETLARIRSGRRASSQHAAELTPALEAFFAKAFAVEIAERFASADEFSSAFSSAVDGTPEGSFREGNHAIAFGRDHTTRGLPRPARLRRAWLASFGVVTVALLAVVWGSSRAPSPIPTVTNRASGATAAQLPTRSPLVAHPTTAAITAPVPSEPLSPPRPPEASKKSKTRSVRAAQSEPPARESGAQRDAVSAVTDPLFGLPVSKSEDSHEDTADLRPSASK